MVKLKEVRFFKGISQIELQNLTGINRAYLSFFENGHLQPTAKQKKALARALRVRVAELWPEPLDSKDSLLTVGEGKSSS